MDTTCTTGRSVRQSTEPSTPEKLDVPGAKCRFCGTPLNHTFVDLGMSPLCESYVTREQLNQVERFYPLHVQVCDQCFLVQLEQYVSAEDIFTEYAYFSSFSDSWLQHAADYVEMIVKRLGLGKESLAVELASNDGYLLQYFVKMGIPALGVEPAANVAKVAREKGVPTLVKFFGCQTAREMVAEGNQADLVVGNNVLAQVPDLNDFVGGIEYPAETTRRGHAGIPAPGPVDGAESIRYHLSRALFVFFTDHRREDFRQAWSDNI